ncbi:sugar ABC transporter, permease [Thermoanaerobacter sp. YS13]|uniref:carbohydrate ABC transporter permease n=1 Tax=Thermoanaerobacter sp. YS13 TaxID=1511746 RepID=UPI0005758991|nr:sugar ABC transporter permease [Thermoanaerobacter sp. YS13]KHO61667.1 sugar ABC transporter, permease [Thermoanaerobacter sp. YS13]
MRKAERSIYWFLLPSTLLLLIFTFYPTIYEITTSFFKIDYIKNITKFVGTSNYVQGISDPLFIVAVKNTFYFVILAVFFETLLGLILALFFNSLESRYAKFLRSIILIPMLLPPITVALTWKMMYDYNYGVINFFIELFGGKAIEWLNSPKLALLSIILTDIWQWTPFAFLVIFAYLQSLPQDIYESADVDGANYFQKLRYITLPLLKPAIFLTALLRTIDTFRVFDKVYVMTGGGPGNSTETISFYIYRNAFRYFQIGYSSSVAIIMVVIVLLFSTPYIRNLMRSTSQ